MAAGNDDIETKLKLFEIKRNRLQTSPGCGGGGGETVIGAGAYGFVYDVSVDGINRIAKKPHSIFLGKVKVAEKNVIVSKFKMECIVLSKLRHPNVVKFIGVIYGSIAIDDISMVMEKMKCDLATFLADKDDISLSTKLAILQDVSFGLVYLHEYSPPILHRDLTARNILLSQDFRAKIADVGVAKLMDPVAMAAEAHTSVPGQIYYMPPESYKVNAKYTLKLDIFSFGHLTLHTILEEYPKVYTISKELETEKPGMTEMLKRQTALDQIGKDHVGIPIIAHCLRDDPDQRPTARELNDSINTLVDKESQTACTDLLKTIQSKDEVIQSLSEEKRILEDHLNVCESDKKKHIEEMSQKLAYCRDLEIENYDLKEEQKARKLETEQTGLLKTIQNKDEMIESLLMTKKTTDVQQKEQAELIGKMSRGLEYADVVEKDRDLLLDYNDNLKKQLKSLEKSRKSLKTKENELKEENASLRQELQELHLDSEGAAQSKSHCKLQKEDEKQQGEIQEDNIDLLASYQELKELALRNNLIVPPLKKKSDKTIRDYDDDDRPLDSNLICPKCQKQYGIGCIQQYRAHYAACMS